MQPQGSILTRILLYVPLILGLLVFLTPEVLVPVCTELVEMKSGALRPMRCAYAAKAEMLLGALLMVTGLLIILYRKTTKLVAALGLIVSAIGIAIILVPQSYIIGVCMHHTMPCRETQKWLVAEGALAIATGLLLWYRYRRST